MSTSTLTQVLSSQRKLPLLITLSADDRKRLYKMGDKRLAFVHNSLNIAQSNRNILPASFDLERFASNYRLTSNLSELLLRCDRESRSLKTTLISAKVTAHTSTG